MNDNENYSYLQEQMHEKNVQWQELIHSYNTPGSFMKINKLMEEGAPFRFKTNNQVYKDYITKIFIKNFSYISKTNNPHLYEHIMKKYNYKNDYIFSAALSSIVFNTIDCTHFLLDELKKRNLDINDKFGRLLNNAINNHSYQVVIKEPCIGLTNVKKLLEMGANTSVCTTQPILTSIEFKKFEIFKVLWTRQLSLDEEHIDYLDNESLKKLCKQIFRLLGKNEKQENINYIVNCCTNYIPQIEARYFILGEKLKNNQSNISEDILSLFYDDHEFFNNIENLSKKYKTNLIFNELVNELKLQESLENKIPMKEEKKNTKKI